jgi:ABC-type glycerol-3-phosphate transport system substrate-binding protein
MTQKKLSRRSFLKLSALTAAGATLASCAQATQVSAPQQPQVAAAEKTPVTIKWWDFPRSWAGSGSAEQPNLWNEELAKKYKDANPHVTVEFTGVSWSDGPQKLDIALTADQGPDVMYGYPALFGKMLSMKVLQPIDTYFATMKKEEVEDFYQVAWDFVSSEGKKWAFPWYYTTEGEWAINTTIAEEAGVKDLLPQGPDFKWTPEQMVEFAKKVTYQRENGDQVWGTVIHTSEQQGINLWHLWSFPYMFGSQLYSEQDRKSEFSSNGGTEAFQLLLDLVETHKVSPPGAAGLTADNVTELWNRKQSAISMRLGAELVIGLEKAIEAGTIEGPFEVMPVLPPVAAGFPQKVGGAVGVQMVFGQKDTNKEGEVMKFVDFLTNSENMEVFSQLSNLTARKSTTTKLAGDDPITKWRIENVLPNMAPYSKAPEDLKIDDAWMQALQSMYAGERKPADAAKWFEDEANKLLQGS